AAILLLPWNGIEMRGIDLGDEQGNVGIHAVISGIADNGVAGASEVFFRGTRHGRIERGEDEVAIERRIEPLNDEIASHGRNRSVQVPIYGACVRLTGRTLGGGNFGEFKPRVIYKKFDQTLANKTSGAENTDAPTSGDILRCRIALPG